MFHALLLAIAIPVPQAPAKPDFTIEIDEQEFPITCAENPAEVARLTTIRRAAQMEVDSFRAAHSSQPLTLEDSEQLLARELTLGKAYMLLAIHLHAQHVCEHPEQRVKPTRDIGV